MNARRATSWCLGIVAAALCAITVISFVRPIRSSATPLLTPMGTPGVDPSAAIDRGYFVFVVQRSAGPADPLGPGVPSWLGVRRDVGLLPGGTVAIDFVYIPTYLPIGVCAAGLMLCRVYSRRRPPGSIERCVQCGYSMRGRPANTACPECGWYDHDNPAAHRASAMFSKTQSEGPGPGAR